MLFYQVFVLFSNYSQAHTIFNLFTIKIKNMSNITLLPSSFILLPVINEEIHDDICKMCESDILGQSCNTAHFQCEGRYCGEAYELFEDQNEFIKHEFTYKPSEYIMKFIESLDYKLMNFEYKVNILYFNMVIKNSYNMGLIKNN